MNPMVLYSAQQIAEMWNVSLSTIRRKEARGEMPPRVRISMRRYGYRQEDVAKMLGRPGEDLTCYPVIFRNTL